MDRTRRSSFRIVEPPAGISCGLSSEAPGASQLGDFQLANTRGRVTASQTRDADAVFSSNATGAAEIIPEQLSQDVRIAVSVAGARQWVERDDGRWIHVFVDASR
jgi:hypothetical protein